MSVVALGGLGMLIFGMLFMCFGNLLEDSALHNSASLKQEAVERISNLCPVVFMTLPAHTMASPRLAEAASLTRLLNPAWSRCREMNSSQEIQEKQLEKMSQQSPHASPSASVVVPDEHVSLHCLSLESAPQHEQRATFTSARFRSLTFFSLLSFSCGSSLRFFEAEGAAAGRGAAEYMASCAATATM